MVNASLFKPFFLCVAIFIVAIFLYFPFLGKRDLWAPDEPRYAQIAKEMLKYKNYTILHLNNKIYKQKPPLFFWSIAIASMPFGYVNEISTRVPGALSASLLCVVIFLITLDIFGSTTIAILSTLCLVGVQKVFWEARFGQIEMVLNFLMFSAFYFFIISIKRRNIYIWLVGCILCALTVLTKGPIGLLFPGVFTLIYIILIAERKFPPIHWFLLGFVMFLIPIFPWAMLVLEHADKSYLFDIFYIQSFGRYTNPWHHYHPFYYYLFTFIPGFFPVVFYLVPLFKKEFWPSTMELKRAILLFLFIAGFVVVFFSISKGKRDIYIIPAYIALCPVTGYVLSRIWYEKIPFIVLFHKFIKWLQIGISIVFILMALCVLIDGIAQLIRSPLIPNNPYSIYESFILGVASYIFWVNTGRKFSRYLYNMDVRFLVSCLIFSFFLHCFLLPPIDRFKSAKPYASEINSIVPKDAVLINFKQPNMGLLFYLDRTMKVFESRKELESLSLNLERNTYIIVYKRDLDEIPYNQYFKVLYCGKIGSKTITLGVYQFQDGTYNLQGA